MVCYPKVSYRADASRENDIGLGSDMKAALRKSLETYTEETKTRQLLAEVEYAEARFTLARKRFGRIGTGSGPTGTGPGALVCAVEGVEGPPSSRVGLSHSPTGGEPALSGRAARAAGRERARMMSSSSARGEGGESPTPMAKPGENRALSGAPATLTSAKLSLPPARRGPRRAAADGIAAAVLAVRDPTAVVYPSSSSDSSYSSSSEEEEDSSAAGPRASQKRRAGGRRAVTEARKGAGVRGGRSAAKGVRKERGKRKRRDLPTAPFSTREFEAIWHTAESRLMLSTEEIESGSFFRDANHTGGGSRAKKKVGLSAVQTRAQYGRTLFAGTKRILDMCRLGADEIFLDIGHGAGNACLQAAFTVGCEARGVEVVSQRCRIAELFREVLLKRAGEIAAEERGRRRNIGDIVLREASLTDPQYRSFMAEADVVLVNNSHGIFGVRSGDVEGKPTLDAYVGGIFAQLKPGARMVTFHPLLCLGRSLSMENERRRKAGMEESLHASFFTVEKMCIGTNVVSWSAVKEISVYLYKRVNQSDGAGAALFLCSNKRCWGNINGTAAIDEHTGLLVDDCIYCGQRRTVMTRR